MKKCNRKKQILKYICGFMFLFGILFICLMFTSWGWWLDVTISSCLPYYSSEVGISVFLGYWAIDFILLLITTCNSCEHSIFN